MSPDDAELARLLERARAADRPAPERLARVRDRLLPPSAANGGGHEPRPSPSWGASSAAWGKVMIGLAVVGLGVGLGLRWNAPRPPARVVEAPRVVAPEAPPKAAEPELAAPALTAEPPAPAPPRATAHKRIVRKPQVEPQAEPAVSAPDTLREQTSLLRMAALSLRAGRIAEARASLEAFQARFPNSQLNAERERLLQRVHAAEQETKP